MSYFSEIITWICILLGYVIGATPFGFLAGKIKGIDIRQHGSGNIGATNVLRTLGKPVGITVLVLDIAKGVLPVVISMLLSRHTEVHIATAIATIIGHNFTFWLKFKGGKGIATTSGSMLPLIPIPLVVAIVTWIVLVKTTRYVSLGSIAAALIIPLTAFLQAIISGTWNWPILIFSLVLSFLAVWRHRSNIKRLLNGEESRFQKKSERSG
jgi:glycerol-3-phosphate acyltransferase PlsY